jgi:hypothetical protein
MMRKQSIVFQSGSLRKRGCSQNKQERNKYNTQWCIGFIARLYLFVVGYTWQFGHPEKQGNRQEQHLRG